MKARFKNLILVFLLFGFLSGCIYQPETGKKVLIATSPAQENKLGEDGYREVLSKSRINKDPRLNSILRRVGRRIAARTNRRDFKWQYTLIESKEMNAWCMPGGKIAVYTGILPVMKNEAGMAAVLGHEVAHAILRHSGQRITQQLIVEAGLSLAEIGLGNRKHKDTILGLLGAGATVGVILPYSRTHEKEADVLGLKYMAGAGYDPREAVELWKRFSRMSGGAPPEFLSTHPGHGTRIKLLQSHVAEAMNLYEASPGKFGTGENL